MLEEYKSREVSFFRDGKWLFLGEEKTPKIVEFLNRIKLFKNQKKAGMLIEVITVFCFGLSILLALSY